MNYSRILLESRAASLAKRVIVSAACRGLIPHGVADRLVKAMRNA